MDRVLEPEVMDTAQEAKDYDAMDHGEVNRRFVDDLLALCPEPKHVVDVGTGTALIPIELCRRHAKVHVVATDLADHMLALARKNVARAGFADRLELEKVDAKSSGLPPGAFDVVMSNSIIHHIPDPARAFAKMIELRKRGGLLFVRDLERPLDDAAARALVERYAKGETPRARDLFEASLRAALTLDEVVAMVAPLGVPPSAITRTSDRHWTLAHRA